MLSELRVRELGVIVDLEVLFEPGLTVISGETGAGKTLIVEALELVLGGRVDPTMVRTGAEEATVEARFVEGEREIVVSRSVAAAGRSRGFLDGRMASASALSELGEELVDLYGQHGHHSLLRADVQREALDRFAGVELAPVRELRARLRGLDGELERLGGDREARRREGELLGHEVAEIERAAIVGPEEAAQLAAEEEVLANVSALREATERAAAALEDGVGEGALRQLGAAIESLGRHEALAGHRARLSGLLAELEDERRELRNTTERFEDDPIRLGEVAARRQLLASLARRHGTDLAGVLALGEEKRARLLELANGEETRADLEAQRSAVRHELAEAEGIVGDERRGAARTLGEAVGGHLAELALAGARLEVRVPPEGIGDAVELLLAANPGEPALPLAKVASGGELARTMLALRLVLTSAPPTLVFDEVDAGIGGAAALAVGRALARLGAEHQVLVVTHLAQVAAAADNHLVVEKSEEGGRSVARLAKVEGEQRLAELSRMLSGHPESGTAREHAAELLASVAGRAAG